MSPASHLEVEIMATEKTPKAPRKPRDPNAPKKTPKKTALRLEVDRVAKATGLPASFILKKVGVRRAEINAARKAALEQLVTEVPAIVAAALQAAAKPPASAPEGAPQS
jgi:hypothetical protein